MRASILYGPARGRAISIRGCLRGLRRVSICREIELGLRGIRLARDDLSARTVTARAARSRDFRCLDAFQVRLVALGLMRRVSAPTVRELAGPAAVYSAQRGSLAIPRAKGISVLTKI